MQEDSNQDLIIKTTMEQTTTVNKRGLAKSSVKVLIQFIAKKENLKKAEVKKCIAKTK